MPNPLRDRADVGAGGEDLAARSAVPAAPPADRLLTAAAIRARCGDVMAAAQRGQTAHFTWHPERLPAASDYVTATIRKRYPTLAVPYHSRWRHFEAGGVDRWSAIAAKAGLTGPERARARIDLVIPSVLLDAGAGPAWRYVDPADGTIHARSEGLGLASLALFARGGFSSRRDAPLRTDGSALRAFSSATLAAAFAAGDDNPLVGLAGRAALLRNLGAVVGAAPAVFGSDGRLGNLFDHLQRNARDGAISAAFLLRTLLRTFGAVWPGRLSLDGVPLGDCGRHPAARGDGADDPTAGLVPFHKLTQWLAYSLLEPLEEAGLAVTGIEALTGLPEYRNGGLLLDTGVLAPRSAALLQRPLAVDDEPVVEWRALTVIALDRLADAVRARLGVDAARFPLACVLEGGTWVAGRKIAAALREGGVPPLTIASDGTVF
jgi:hypothetical protein